MKYFLFIIVIFCGIQVWLYQGPAADRSPVSDAHMTVVEWMTISYFFMGTACGWAIHCIDELDRKEKRR